MAFSARKLSQYVNQKTSGVIFTRVREAALETFKQVLDP